MTDPILTFCILINQRERNKAIGIAHDTQLLRGMSGYIFEQAGHQVNNEISKVAKAVYLKSNIEEYAILAKNLTDYITANIENKDIRSEGVYIMKYLESYISYLGEELDNLWQH